MENGSPLGVYLAYAAICLFLLIVALVLLRTMMLMSLLLVEPIRYVWARLAGRARTSRPRSTGEEVRSDADEGGADAER